MNFVKSMQYKPILETAPSNSGPPSKTNPNKLMNNGVENYRFVEIRYAMDMEKSIVGLADYGEYNDEEKNHASHGLEQNN